MKYFGHVDESGSLGLVLEMGDDEGTSEEYVELTNWTGWTPRPSPNHAMRQIQGVWQWVDSRAVEQARAQKRLEINAARLAANQTSFTFDGKAIAVDPLSRSDIDATNGMVALLGALPPGFPGAWKAIDNTYVSIPDVATWTSFYGAMVAQGTANFTHSQNLKADLDLAETLAAVDAITW